MIYFLLFSDNQGRLMRLEGEALDQVVAKNLDEAKERAWRELYRSGFRYCLIFTEVPEPVKLALLDKLEESVKHFSTTLERWF